MKVKRRSGNAINQLHRDVERDEEAPDPNVQGVPTLRAFVDSPAQLPKLVRKYLPEVEKDRRLHALSFVDPIRVANILGIRFSPQMDRLLRRQMRGFVSFDAGRSMDATESTLHGIDEIQWKLNGKEAK